MPRFDTKEPISVTIELAAGDIQLVASDRTDTVVEVRPSDESDESDVKAAQQTRVEYADGTLTVRGLKTLAHAFSSKSKSVDVLVELPTGSEVDSQMSAGDVRGTGRLGGCRFKTSVGHIRLDRTGALRVDTGAGHVTVDRVTGDAEIATGTGRVRIGTLDGSVVVKNSNGDTEIGQVTGDLRVQASNGNISVDQATGVRNDAKTANGSVRFGELARGSAVLKTATGDLEAGITSGTAVWLDLHTSYGRVSNSLDDVPGPDEAEETLEVHASTSHGDVTVRRS